MLTEVEVEGIEKLENIKSGESNNSNMIPNNYSKIGICSNI